MSEVSGEVLDTTLAQEPSYGLYFTSYGNKLFLNA